MTNWESYEQVAAYLLDQFATEFGLSRVEGKQAVVGLRSGTAWEIDAKGFRQDGSGFIIIECRRSTASKQKQEQVGGLAYRVTDAGAQGGIIVTPVGLQEGAARVATAENIICVCLNEDSTRYEYILRFMEKIMVGLQESLHFAASLEVEVRDKNGNIILRRKSG
jgi:hypothetical protein